jgi:hypothetical protein
MAYELRDPRDMHDIQALVLCAVELSHELLPGKHGAGTKQGPWGALRFAVLVPGRLNWGC